MLSLRRGGADHLNLPTQPGFVSISRVFVDSPLLDGLIDERKCLGKKPLGRFLVLVFDRLSQFFYLRAEDRFVAPVYRVSSEAVSPLALR